jgi:hypothetical protein
VRPVKIILHFNRQRAKAGFPWTVHVRGRCIPASDVIINAPVRTVYKPDKPTNPRAWLEVRGFVEEADGVVTVVAG